MKAQLKIDSVSISVSFFARDISPRVNIGSMKCIPRLSFLSNIFLFSYTKTKTKKKTKTKTTALPPTQTPPPPPITGRQLLPAVKHFPF